MYSTAEALEGCDWEGEEPHHIPAKDAMGPGMGSLDCILHSLTSLRWKDSRETQQHAPLLLPSQGAASPPCIWQCVPCPFRVGQLEDMGQLEQAGLAEGPSDELHADGQRGLCVGAPSPPAAAQPHGTVTAGRPARLMFTVIMSPGRGGERGEGLSKHGMWWSMGSSECMQVEHTGPTQYEHLVAKIQGGVEPQSAAAPRKATTPPSFQLAPSSQFASGQHDLSGPAPSPLYMVSGSSEIWPSS